MNIVIPNGFEPNYTIGFVKGLFAHQVDFLVISSDKTHENLIRSNIKSINLRGSQSENRAPIIKILNFLRYYTQLIVFLLRNRGATIHFTGIFSNNNIVFEGIFFNLFFKLISSKYIYTAHNLLPHNKDDSRFYKLLYSYIYKVPEIIVAHTEAMKMELRKYFGIAREKIKVMSIGLNEEVPITGISKSHARSQLGLSHTDNLLLFFGKIDEYKGLDLVINTLDEFSLGTFRLLIAGRFANIDYEKKIKQMIRFSKCRNNIHLYDKFILNHDVEVFFRSSDVLIVAYKQIYQSGVLFLSLRFGIPIIATNVGSLKEFIGKDIGVITKTNDVDGLANSLTYFFDNRNKFSNEKIIEKSRNYQWKNTCQTVLSIYKEG